MQDDPRPIAPRLKGPATGLERSSTVPAVRTDEDGAVQVRVLSSVVLSVAFLAIPMAIAFSNLRYRLYEIDRLISRTVSYGLVTALLAGVYLAVVFVMRALLSVDGELPVAASTLAVAALYNPLRRRVQARLDRHFNRSRYNALRIVEAFGQRLREETGMESLRMDRATFAVRTTAPASVSL